MPNIEASKKDFESLLGMKVKDKQQLEELLMFAKCELDALDGDALKIDCKDTNRPDLWSIEGIAREIRLRTGKQKGMAKYKIKKSNLKVKVEKSVEDVRPLTACAVIKGVKVTDELLRQIIQLQEKIHGSFGSKRKEAAMGIYDYGKIHGNIRYYGAEPRKTKFIPLDFKNEMDLDEILELHPKGREYAFLLKGKERYPIFEDSEGHILSMPPIINSDYSGKVTMETKNLFIEVSGFSHGKINTALNVIVSAIAERAGRIYSVEVIYPKGKKTTPDFSLKQKEVSIERIRAISGLGLKDNEIIGLLMKAGYAVSKKGKKILCRYSSFRNDIMHEADIIEDVIIGYGYNRIEPLEIRMPVYGKENADEKVKEAFAELCIGMGLQEVVTFTLTSKEKQSSMVSCSEEKIVEISNPMSLNWAVLRRNIFPELLEFLSKNKDAGYPQKIFEIGKAVEIDGKSGTGTFVAEKNKLCIIASSQEVNFTAIKSVFDAVKENTGRDYSVSESGEKFLEEGKSADIMLGGKKIGFMGEVNRKTVQNFGLKMPVALLEMEI